MSKLIRLTRAKNYQGDLEEVFIAKQHIELFYRTTHRVFDEPNKVVTYVGLVDGGVYVDETPAYIAKCIEEGV